MTASFGINDSQSAGSKLRRRFVPPFRGARASDGGRFAIRARVAPRLEPLEDRMLLANFPVTSNADSGVGTLRSAIYAVDASTDRSNEIDFNLPSNQETITLTSPLPPISEPVYINGTSQPGFAGPPLVTIAAGAAGDLDDDAGLYLEDGSSGSVIQYLVINGFTGGVGFLDLASGITLNSSDNVVVNCYIGTDVDGESADPNYIGVLVDGSGNSIGGATSATGNVISGNAGAGIFIGGDSCLVTGNLVGTNAEDDSAVGNIGGGIIVDAPGATIGATTAGAGNVISGNGQGGLVLEYTSVVEGNRIGTGIFGDPLPNTGFGISAFGEPDPPIITLIAPNTISDNIIAYNTEGGVMSDPDASNTVRFNAIFANKGLGIEQDDSDGVFNAAPVLTSVADGVVTGSLISDPDSIYVVDFYANPSDDPSPQGRYYLTSTTIETDASGNAIFRVPYTPFPGAPVLTATSTDANGVTSEFSPPFSEPPLPLGYAISATGVTFTATTDKFFNGTVATFTSTAPMPTAADFTATIDWGDGSPSTTGTILAAPTGFIVVGSHTFEAANTLVPVTVSIAETDGAGSATGHSLANVVNPVSVVPQSVDFVAGTFSSEVVASFSDSDPQAFPSQFTAQINWGDSSANTAGVISSDGAGFDITGSHAYNRAGSYDIIVTVTDARTSGVALVLSSAQVNPVPPITIQTTNFAVIAGKRFRGTVANFTDGDPRTDPSFYTATIDWGDGSTPTTGTISGSNPFTVTASHTFAAFSDTDIATITITDQNGRSVFGYDRIVDPPAPAATSPALLALVPQPLALSPNKPFEGAVATLTDTDPTAPASDFKAIINWGKGRKSAGTITGTSGHYVVSARHKFPRFAGKKPVSVTVIGPDGQTLQLRELASYSAPRLLASERTPRAQKPRA
jgi:hypothetical protein